MDRRRDMRLLVVLLTLVALALPSTPADAQLNAIGEWRLLSQTLPLNPIHVALLHTGRVLIAAGSENDPTVTTYRAALQRLATAGRPVVVIDVRPAEAYRRGRLPGARARSHSTLVSRRAEIPADAIVVLYGADRVDEAAAASRYLRASGHAQVFVLEGGFAGWQGSGLGAER